MPVFEYRCQDCGAQVELFVRVRDEIPRCPACESRKLERLMSAPAGHVSGRSLPLAGSGCPPSDAPPCNPYCCRIPQS